MSPLQLGLGVFLFRKVGSKQIVETVSNMGFCSSYSSVALFEASAVQSWKPDISTHSFSQFSFDNADFNISTMTGKGTFHAMGGIRCVTPASGLENQIVSKLSVMTSSKETATAQKIDILTFQRRDRVGIEDVALRNVYQEGTFTKTTVPSNHDFAWMMGKFLEKSSIPSWQGFMEKITSVEPYTQSQVLALPFINNPPTDYNTILTALTYVVTESKKSMQQTVFITFDQPLYMKAKDILAVETNSKNELFSNVVIRLGGFHLIMSFLGAIGFLMKDSGLSQLFETVYAPASVPHMLYGHAYTRAIQAHCATLSALSTIILDEMPITEKEKNHINDCLSDLSLSAPSFRDLESDLVVEKLRNQFVNTMNDIKQKGKTAQLWLQYCELVILVLHFIQAERMGNWELHMQCVRAMLPVFHATGHFPYAKACQLYLQDMEKLEEIMNPEQFYEFTKGSFFTVRRSDKYWCGVWTDMVIEQTLMKNFKSVGGVSHGRGFTDSVLNRWICGIPVAHHICEAMETFCNAHSVSSNQHVELRCGRIETDEKIRKTFHLWLQQHSPFVCKEQLYSVASGLVASEEVNCYKAVSIGEEVLKKIGSEIKKFGSLKLKRSCMARTMCMSIVTFNKDVIEVDTTQLFQRILCMIHSPDDLKNCFTYELSSVPLSLFDSSGFMRKSKKSSLYTFFNEVPERHFSDNEETFFVIDGGFLIHYVIWPKYGTFGDIYARIISFIQRHYKKNVAVVFDGYCESSLNTKTVERQRRSMKRSSRDLFFNEETMCVESQSHFLSNLNNKEKFIAQLKQKLENFGIETSIAKDDADVDIVRKAISASQLFRQVVIVGQDIDLLILLIALAPEDKDILMMKESKGNVKTRCYSSKDIRDSALIHDCKESILFLHAISVCDTTSALFGKGKLHIFQSFNRSQHLHDIPRVFTNPTSSPEAIRKAGEKFILSLYTNKKKSTDSLNDYRFHSFNVLVGRASNAVILPRLPPTIDAACLHSYRVYLQIQLWLGNSLDPKNWGWRESNSSLSPIFMKRAPAPEKILLLISCGCSQGCGRKCKCVKANLHCTAMCRSCRGQSCKNAIPSDLTDEFETECY